jgi:hypothetical protein
LDKNIRRKIMSVIIKDIKKTGNEIIRFEISEFKGRELINIRVWYQSMDEKGNSVFKPTQKGIALNVAQFDELKDGIEKIQNYLNDKNNGTNSG